MKGVTAVLGFSMFVLLAACSGDEQAQTTEPPSSKSVTASTEAPLTSSPVQQTVSPVKQTVSAAGSDNCRAILESACEFCHSETRICQKLGKKSESRWRRTVERMIKRGAKLTSDQEATLVNCLTNESPDIVQVCK